MIKLSECIKNKHNFDCPKCGLGLTTRFLRFEFNQLVKLICPRCKKAISILNDLEEKVLLN